MTLGRNVNPAETRADEGAMTPEQLQNARVGYEAAIALRGYEGTLTWAKFNSMLVAHSIILGTLGLATASGKGAAQVVECLTGLGLWTVGAAGLALCLIWYLTTRRGIERHAFWADSARLLEERLGPIENLSRGDRHRRGETIELPRADRLADRHKLFAWRLGVPVLAYCQIAIFALFYCAMLLHSL
jgi:hypothetical protein